MNPIFPILLLALSLSPALASGGKWKSKGEATVESRIFTDDDNDTTIDDGLGLFTRLEASYKKKRWRAKIRFFARTDRQDTSRDLSALEEAWLGYKKGPWQFRAGYQMLNWTATEAFHPADVINSRNLDSNIENPEKLGEAMVSLRYRIRDGGLTLYYMPLMEEPELPGSSSRLGFLPAGFDYIDPLWLSEEDELEDDTQVNQFGFRFTQMVGDGEIGIHYLDHIDRSQPLAIPLFTTEGNALVQPIYFRVQDYGLTYTHVLGGLLLKIEAGHRDFIDADPIILGQASNGLFTSHTDHTQGALGFEYALAYANGQETSWLLEYQNYFGVNEMERAQLGIFQRDALIGFRHTFNDAMAREILFTAITDLERSHEYLLNFSYSQRLSDTWTIKTGFRYVDAPIKESQAVGLELLDESNQAFLNISRHF